jgi:hypothetical protein
MPSMEELVHSIEEYGVGRLALDDFEDRFRDNSRGMFGSSQDVLEVCLLIESAFSHLRFEDTSEDVFRAELAAAIRPFVQPVVANSEPVLVFHNQSLQSCDIVFSSSGIQAGNNNSTSWIQWDESERSPCDRNPITQGYQVMNAKLFYEDVDWRYKINTSRCAAIA